MPGTDANIWPNNIYVTAKALGGAIWELYQYLSWIKDQRFATTADGDQLDEHGVPFGISRNPASAATGDIIITGTAGYTVVEGTVFERSDGIQFETTVDVVLDATGSGTVNALALSFGVDTNTVSETELTPIVANADITSALVNEIGLTGGADIEDDEALRARILLRKRFPPQGGAVHDYVFWALNISGVTRVWVDPLAYGPGTVGVWFMTDDSTANGIPDAVTLGNVEAYINTQKPVTANVTIQAPTAATIDITVDLEGTPTQAVQDRISAEIAEVFRRQVQVSLPNTPYTLNENLFWQAVAQATGSSAHTVDLKISNLTLSAGYVPVMGTVCFT
jgi:uncharacterized phage protein gp47/JayE